MTPAPVQAIGPYRLGRLLGRGGMGEVYKAYDQRLGRFVAVKRIRPEAADNPQARERFQSEARIAAQLGHPSIGQVFDILEQNGDAWIVMELIDGPTLAEMLRDGPLDVGLAISYAQQVASGLADAHALGIVHRDLKTENVMVLPSGHVKVLDFGLARWSLGDRSPGSVSARPSGTPRALSPEQVSGGKVDGRSDLFSLGVMLYELLTARSPFRDKTTVGTLARVETHQQPPARRLNPKIPRRLSDLVERLLAKDPEDRPDDAGTVAELLAQIAETSPLYRSLSPPQGRSPADATGLENTWAMATTYDLSVSDVSVSNTPVGDVVVRTLLLSELVDSHRLIEELGDAEALLNRHNRLATDLLTEHGGREIDRTDGFLLLFERPWRAVSYAMAFHQGLRQLSSELGVGLASRVGIHLGEVILYNNLPEDVSPGAKPLEVEGLAKPTAARLMSLATGGQTLLTRGAYNVARRGAIGSGRGQALSEETADGLRWLNHGHYRFRGFADDVEIFEVGIPGVAPLVAPKGSANVQRVESAREIEPQAAAEEAPSIRLRRWPPVELPERPYPVLLPYTHPALLAGREREIAKLRRLLAEPVLILGLCAPSGTGKSSLLLGGLVPALREEGRPVAVVRHPHEQGVADRLFGDLIEDDTVLGGWCEIQPHARARDFSPDQGAKPQTYWSISRISQHRDGGKDPLAARPEFHTRLLGAEAPPWRDFVDRLSEVERLAGEAPILVLDQFEDVLSPEASEARATLGVLLAATALRRPGIEAPTCRWLLAYRQELHGEVLAWLRDVLHDAHSASVAKIENLPYDLSTVDRFHSMPLPPLATPSPGANAHADATRVFQAAIEKPLAVTAVTAASGAPRSPGGGPTKPHSPEGGPTKHYPWRIAADGAERLAKAFAEARLDRPEAPLTPELQVVLAYLLARAGKDSVLEVPEDPGTLIERALEDHLRRALETAFPASESGAEQADGRTADVRTRRTRALLALRELASATRAGKEGLPADELSRAIGDGGDEVLEKLATSLTRLVVVQEHPDGWRYVLSHDRMAEVVVRTVEAEGGGRLPVDAELLRLRRFVALETALYRSGEATAPRLPRRHFERIADNAEALLWDEERRAWWTACRRRRRTDRRRAWVGALVTTALLALIAFGVWSWAAARATRRALLDQVAQGEPEAAFQALDRLRREDVGAERLRLLLRRREVPSALLERGLGGLTGAERNAAVLAAVELMLPLVEETPEDPVLIANLGWALDFAPARSPHSAARARELRDRVLAPLRRLRPEPPQPDQGDPDWIEIPAGSFLMGTGDGEEGDTDERPRHEVTVSAFRLQRHEVTNREYRRLSPDQQGHADMPTQSVSWYQAYTYAAWLGGRLPTEAEWEYAARAGCPYRYCDGAGQETALDAVAWTLRNSRDAVTGELAPRPVMRLAPNPWGLYDMLGNLWEWTADWYDGYSAEPQIDPWGPGGPAPTSGRRVFRGGSFWDRTDGARATDRLWNAPGNRDGDQGFRVLLTTRDIPLDR